MQEPVTAPAVDEFESDVSDQPASDVAAPVAAPPPAIAATTDADESLEAHSDPGDEDPEPVTLKKDSVQARINKAIAAQRQAERERDEYRARVEAAERQSRSPKGDDAKREPQYTRPKPTEAEIGTKYAGYPEFVEDLADWKLEQRDAAQAVLAQRAAVQQRHEAHATKFKGLISKAEASDPQFWSKIAPQIVDLAPSTAYDPSQMQGAVDAARKGDRTAQLFLSQVEIADAIFDSDYATDLMAHFSANMSDFQRLSTLPPKQIAREIGRLEARFTRSEAASPGPAPKTPAVSQAPPPIKPVAATANAESLNPLEDDLSLEEHIKVMNARDRKRGLR